MKNPRTLALVAIATLLARGELEQAEALCRERIATGNAGARVHVQLATICGRSGRWQELREQIGRALALAPEDSEAHNILGIAQRQAGDLDGAIVSYRTALAMRPAFAAAPGNLGNAATAGRMASAVR